MTSGLPAFLGGVGLFLFGMEVMTAALREMAGETLRHWLARFTATPVKGAVTGAMAAGVIQSSGAVAVMTIGFVGAGLIAFPQSIGVLFGANVGATVIGWLILLGGMRLKLGTLALPVLFVASLMGFAGRGWPERAGRLAAGFSLLFIGIDMMQTAILAMQGWLVPLLPQGGSLPVLALLALVGVALAGLMHSSGVGLAMVLVLLPSGAIGFLPAAALVIGLNIGSAFTALLASIGGNRAMRLAALADIGFKLVAALVLFPLLSWLAPLLHATPLGSDDQAALVLFHTLFNLTGAALLLPVTRAYAAAIEHMVPQRSASLAEALQPHLLQDEGAALDAADETLRRLRQAIGAALATAFGPTRKRQALDRLQAEIPPALAELEDWLAHVRVAPGHQAAMARYGAQMHMLDHLTRLMARASEIGSLDAILRDPALRRAAAALSTAMLQAEPAARMARLQGLITKRAHRHRRGALLREHAGLIDVREVFRLTDAMRWLERVAEHGERLAHYAKISGNALR